MEGKVRKIKINPLVIAVLAVALGVALAFIGVWGFSPDLAMIFLGVALVAGGLLAIDIPDRKRNRA